jgi:hypothetical protein
MEVIFFNLSLEWILVMKMSEISADQAPHHEVRGGFRHPACPILLRRLHQLNLL